MFKFEPLFLSYHAHTHIHIHTLTYIHTHTHAHRDIQGFRGGTLRGCVLFSSEENFITIISNQVAADIMNWAFQT